MKQALAALLVAVALVAAASPSAAHKPKAKPTLSPLLPAPAPSGAMGFYLVKGTHILSSAYPNVAACYADLAKLKQSMSPGTDSIACAHRRP